MNITVPERIIALIQYRNDIVNGNYQPENLVEVLDELNRQLASYLATEARDNGLL